MHARITSFSRALRLVALLTLSLAAASPARAIDQWATKVIAFSSQYSTGGWSAAQVLGPSNTASYGDIGTSWTASSINGTSEYLAVGYDLPVFANGVTIRETDGNGFITQVDVIDLDGNLHTVWTGTDPSAQGTPVDFLVSFPQTTYSVKGVKVYVDTNHSSTWEEIDSIQLHGPIAPGPADEWATSVVDFSTQYSTGNYSAAQALGQPDVPSYGDNGYAWTPATMNGGAEHITVAYDYPVYADSVTVRESSGAGCVTQIDLLDTSNVLHTVWSGTDPSPDGAIADYTVNFTQTSYLVKGVRVYTDTNHNLNQWEEIDSIQLHGQTSNLNGLTLSPVSVASGKTSKATVTLYSAAPAAGYTLALSTSDTSLATVPASITIPSGATSGTFTVQAVGSSAPDTPVTITASAGGGDSRSAVLKVQPATLSSVTLSPSTQTGGKTVTGKANLSGPAGTGGTTVTLTSANSAATVPGTVTVAAGAKFGSFTITTSSVAANTTGNISGKLGTTTKSANLTLIPPAVSSLALSPAKVPGGKNVTGKVTLNAPAPPGGTTVTLSNANGAATVPGSMVVAAGSLTGTFTITTVPVTANTAGAVGASAGGGSKSVTLTVTPPALSKLTLSPGSVTGGTNSIGTVTLTGKAPAGGTTVALSTSNGAVAQPVDGSNNPITSVTVPAGVDHVTFTVKTSTVGASTTVTIGANLGAVTKNVVLTVHP